MQLNSGMLHIQLNTEFNSRTRPLINYNVCKHLNVSGIYMRGHHKRLDSFEIKKLIGLYTCSSTFV
jgi:hypothetical protein